MDCIENIALEIGAEMIESGAEISRVEDTITRILTSHGVKEINVFCISSVIIITSENTTVTKRIKKNELDLFKIDYLNTKSRALCEGTEFEGAENRYNKIVQIISVFLATGSFCIYFGGSIRDAVFSGISGLIISYRKSIVSGIFARNFCDSTIAGVLAFIPLFFLNDIHPDKIMIGTIMLLIPGLTIGNAIRDIMSSDIISGVIELTEAIFIALSISLGFSLAVFIFGYN